MFKDTMQKGIKKKCSLIEVLCEVVMFKCGSISVNIITILGTMITTIPLDSFGVIMSSAIY